MDHTHLESIQEAASDPVRLNELLKAVEAQGADRAKGVEDVTRELKTKAARLEEDREKWRALGDRRDVEAKLEELSALRAKIANTDAELAATAAGVDNAQVEKMAEERANAKLEVLKAEWVPRIQDLEDNLKSAAADRESLTDKLKSAIVDHQIYAAGGSDADPLLYKYLRDHAEPFFRPVTNGESDSEWWRADSPEWEIVDPKTGAVLMAPTSTNPMNPMSAKELLAAKKSTEWASFWPARGRGGGMSSTPGEVGEGRLPADAGSHAFFDKMFGNP